MPAELDFEQLFFETERMIYNLGLRLFRNNEDDALDFTQDVYLQAYHKLHTFAGRSRPSTWLYSLALHFGLKRIKKEKRLKMQAGDEALLENLEAPRSTQPDERVLQLLNQKEVSRQLEAALASLPEALRLPVVLHYLEKMPYVEMAAELQIPEGTLKSSVYRAKLQLRKQLQKELLE
ncbi:MAG: RNA polymerase sigma factor [Leptospiraceae bacterium]|nr:RNA polymerase sigma factor [Leptospiraceae bacterium]